MNTTPAIPQVTVNHQNISGDRLQSQELIYAAGSIALSAGITQCIGSVRLVTSCALIMFYTIKAAYHAAALSLVNINSQGSTDNVEQTKHQLFHTFKNQQAIAGLRETSRYFLASLASLIPLFGALAAGFLLHKTSFIPSGLYPYPSVQDCCDAYAEYVMSPFAPLANIALYPFSYINQSGEQLEETYRSRLNLANCPQVNLYLPVFPLPVDRGDGLDHAIRCCYLPAIPSSGETVTNFTANSNHQNKTMVLFHGNAMVGEDMSEIAVFYALHGWNVLAMTMGGYNQSDECITTSEITTIQDVNAVMRHLEELGVSQIGVHGSSIGGSLAMHATKLSDRVVCAIVDKTFDSAENVASNLMKNMRNLLTSAIPSTLVKALFRRVCPIGIAVPGVNYEHGPYRTDGLNNVAKAASYRGVLLTISGNADDMMGVDYDNTTGRYRANLCSSIYEAHRRANPPERSMHCSTFMRHDINLVTTSEQAILEALRVCA